MWDQVSNLDLKIVHSLDILSITKYPPPPLCKLKSSCLARSLLPPFVQSISTPSTRLCVCTICLFSLYMFQVEGYVCQYNTLPLPPTCILQQYLRWKHNYGIDNSVWYMHYSYCTGDNVDLMDHTCLWIWFARVMVTTPSPFPLYMYTHTVHAHKQTEVDRRLEVEIRIYLGNNPQTCNCYEIVNGWCNGGYLAHYSSLCNYALNPHFATSFRLEQAMSTTEHVVGHLLIATSNSWSCIAQYLSKYLCVCLHAIDSWPYLLPLRAYMYVWQYACTCHTWHNDLSGVRVEARWSPS